MQDKNIEEMMEEVNSNINNPPSPDTPRVVQTDTDAKDGQNKCPKCGSTDIALNVSNQKLRCNFCRHEFESEKVVGLETDISQLEGQIIGSGASDIVADTNEILTFKCGSCGAEVVIDTTEATQARCHWCRNTLSVNQQIPNGAIPDMVLPFGINKDTAKVEIEKFVGKRKFFAHPKFKAEFTTQNVMGVYFPYMVIDINAHANLSGQGEHLAKSYTRGIGNNQKTYYDADLYNVEREFDIIVNGLTVESSADKLNNKASNKTNNVINAIMPFDIENCAKWNANYLKGYTSEKRDTNIDQLKTLVNNQAKDIARHSANETLKDYDRGVCWSSEQLAVKGQQWKAAYLPVWLYSYQQVKGKNKMLHYVAVNARTKETTGSVPIHMPKLLGVSIIIEATGLIFWWTILIDWDYGWFCILLGFIYFFIMFTRYRNSNARHIYEKETKTQMANLRKADNLVQRRTGLTNSRIEGANNTSISGQSIGNKMLDSLVESNQIASFIINKGGNK
ncbi:MAG: hypothetical protein PHH93_05625 [Prolixibacteraceae bacterium]|nr:hypothetical protein [Prolixibacteraceae bacterium]